MITAEQIRSTGPGEVFEVAGLFRKLDPNATVQLVCNELHSHASGPRATFDASYHGIALGNWTADVFGEDVKWTF